MPIIIIAADDRKIEEQIVDQVAGEKKYELLDRRRLKEIAAGCQTSAEKLVGVLETTPSVFKKMPLRQWRQLLSCLEAGVLTRLLADNLVCCGLAAHLYVTDVSHAMKIRLLSGKKQRIALLTGRGMSPEKAEKSLAAELARRRKWSLAAFNVDETDLSGYDMVISLDQIDPVEAVRTIIGASEYRKFQAVTYSTKTLSDLALAARVEAVLFKEMNNVRVQARDGAVVVSTGALRHQKRKKVEAIKSLAGGIEGVSYVEVHVNRTLSKETA